MPAGSTLSAFPPATQLLRLKMTVEKKHYFSDIKKHPEKVGGASWILSGSFSGGPSFMNDLSGEKQPVK